MIITEQSARMLHKKYARSDDYFERTWNHCLIVRDIALWCAGNVDTHIDVDLLEKACLVHDIGSTVFMGDGFDYSLYLQHAILGAALLIDEGVDPDIATLVKNHLQVSLSKQDVIDNNLRLPRISYEPTSIESRILNYADRFHSKTPVLISLDANIAKFEKYMPSQVPLLRACAQEFGVPDLEALAKQYDYPIRTS